LLAERLGVPFIELDREIERASGIALATIFDLYGQAGFRRLERRCLEQVIDEHPRFVLATGGSLVSEAATFERLLEACWTVWLQAAPAEHMGRVVAQGDMRPMAGNASRCATSSGSSPAANRSTGGPMRSSTPAGGRSRRAWTPFRLPSPACNIMLALADLDAV